MVGTWADDEYLSTNYDRVAVIGMVQRLDLRRALERQTAQELRERGDEVSEGLEVFSLDFEPTEDNRDMMKEKLDAQGIDAVVTLGVLDIDEEQRYIPGSTGYRPRTYVNPLFTYYSNTYNLVYNPGYYANSTEVFMESNLFDLDANKVIWSGQSRTYERQSVYGFADDFAATVVESMDESQML